MTRSLPKRPIGASAKPCTISRNRSGLACANCLRSQLELSIVGSTAVLLLRSSCELIEDDVVVALMRLCRPAVAVSLALSRSTRTRDELGALVHHERGRYFCGGLLANLWVRALWATGVATLAGLVIVPVALAASSDPHRAKPYAAIAAAGMAVLFFGVFFDPRRPLRLLHFDLAVLLAFLIPDALGRAGFDSWPLMTTPLLAYLLARMLWIGCRPRPAHGPLLPVISTRALTVVLFVLLGIRVALNLDGGVIDVGYGSVIGADRVVQGESLYEGEFPDLVRPGYFEHGDPYGPFTHLAYVPFETVFPWSGSWDSLPAAHAAAISFDLLVIGGLFMLGRSLWPERGRELGVAMAFAWVAYPYSLLILVFSTNDGLVAALLVWTLVLARFPVGRGAMLALGTAAKFVAGALVPLFATATGRRPREVLTFAIVFVATFMLVTIPLLPDGGFSEVWDRTVGRQIEKPPAGTIWNVVPATDALRPLVQIAGVALAIIVALVPRRRTLSQVAALGAAVLIALELSHTFWTFTYISWWAPLLLAALLARHRGAEEAGGDVARTPTRSVEGESRESAPSAL